MSLSVKCEHLYQLGQRDDWGGGWWSWERRGAEAPGNTVIGPSSCSCVGQARVTGLTI